MKKTIFIDGMAVVHRDDEGKMYFEFIPDDPHQQEVEPCRINGSAQLMRSGLYSFVQAKKRIRNNDLLICKATHGRLSGTRDHAWQLTLKAFMSEGIDWQRAFVCETVDVMTKLMGKERMERLLKELLLSVAMTDEGIESEAL